MKILFVCLGNICRSPTAEGVLRAIASKEFPDIDLHVDSAGTADYHAGEPPDRRTVAAARRRGYDLSALRARVVVADDFDRFDYILAMDRANLSELTARRLTGSTAEVALFMSFVPGHEYQEVPDPYFGGIEEFERVLDLCEAAARGLLARLREAQTRRPADRSAGP